MKEAFDFKNIRTNWIEDSVETDKVSLWQKIEAKERKERWYYSKYFVFFLGVFVALLVNWIYTSKNYKSTPLLKDEYSIHETDLTTANKQKTTIENEEIKLLNRSNKNNLASNLNEAIKTSPFSKNISIPKNNIEKQLEIHSQTKVIRPSSSDIIKSNNARTEKRTNNEILNVEFTEQSKKTNSKNNILKTKNFNQIFALSPYYLEYVKSQQEENKIRCYLDINHIGPKDHLLYNNGYYLHFSYGLAKSYNKVTDSNNEASSYQDRLNQSLSKNTSAFYELNIGKSLGRNIAFEIGIRYQNTQQIFEGSQETIERQWVHSDTAFHQFIDGNKIYIGGIIEALVKTERSVRNINTIKTYSIPVRIKYDLPIKIKDIRPFFKIGTQINLRRNWTGIIWNRNMDFMEFSNIKAKNEIDFNLSNNFYSELGSSINFHPFQLQMGINFYSNIHQFNIQNHLLEFKQNALGLYLGISYKL